MWPFKDKAVEPLKIGDRVLMLDGPMWKAHRQLIGRQATILGLPSATNAYNFRPQSPFAKDFYLLDVQGFGRFGASRAHMKKLDDGQDPFEEPRDISSDTPNNVVTWDKVAWQPTKENA